MIILIIDGKRIGTSTLSWNTGDGRAGHTVEHIDFAISMEDLLRIARAEKVEGELEQTTFELSDANLAAMRALASEIESPLLRKKHN